MTSPHISMAGTGHIAQPIVRGLWCIVLLVPGRGGEAVTEETQHFPPHTSRRPRRIFRAQSYPITQEMFNLVLPTQVVWKSSRSMKTFNTAPLTTLIWNANMILGYIASSTLAVLTFLGINRCPFSFLMWAQPIMWFCTLFFSQCHLPNERGIW